jgi:hypothetical protein
MSVRVGICSKVPIFRGLSTGVLVALFAACGGGERAEPEAGVAASAAVASSSFDPCALLTPGEVGEAVGWTVVKATPYVQGNLGHCKWEGEKSNTVLPPEQSEGGVIACFTNFPCPSDMPTSFASSEELVAFRKKLYEGNAYGLDPVITPIEGLGVPALMHELATMYSFEAWLGDHRLAYVSVWGSEAAARSLGEKVLTRAK